MPLFKYPAIRRFRRRQPEHFKSEGPESGSITIELNRLVNTVKDARTRKSVISEMQTFLSLYRRYLTEKTQPDKLDWKKVSPPSQAHIVDYNQLPNGNTSALAKLAVLKLNGGLGTSMGMAGAKSALEVQNDLTFLDLIVQQIEHMNTIEKSDVPLLLMTSFNTEEDTLRIIKKYANQQVKITTFNQSRYPRILKDTKLPIARSVNEGKSAWYPPGHGDLYTSLHRSGVLDRLLAEGKEYLFVSDSDNLGAVVDRGILQHMIETESEFIMEVTHKTKLDAMIGTLVEHDGQLRYLDNAQVPEEFMDEFNDARKFNLVNTDNLWIDLKALKRLLETTLELDIISKTKTLDDGRVILQLQTAAGSAIKHFHNARCINVPRSRFLPVKNCSDLLRVKSDLFVLEHGRLVMSQHRMFTTMPSIKLGGHFKKIQEFQKRFKQIPNILELDHLTVSGDVYFGRNVILRGTVIIIAEEGQHIDIPDGCIIEDRVIYGNLNITEL